MATLALGVVGASVAGSLFGGATSAAFLGLTVGQVGLAVGSTVGSIVDSLLVFPAIFGSDGNQRGPRLSDLEVSLGAEGTGMPFIFGLENRVGGTYTYLSDLIEKAVKRSPSGGGGKGGPSPSVTDFTYHVHAEISFGEASSGPGLITKVILDSKTVFEMNTSHDGFDSAISLIKTNGTSTTQQEIDDALIGTNAQTTQLYRVGVTRSGRNYVNRPAVNTVQVDNATFSVAVNDTLRFEGHDTVYTVDTAASPSSGVLNISFTPNLKRFVGNNENVYINRAVTVGKQAADIRIYNGTTDQVSDSLIQGLLGATNVTANRGQLKIVFEDLNLADWGNRPPQARATIAEPVELISDVLDTLCDRAGMSSSQYNTAGVFGCLRGYTIVGPQRTSRVLEALMQVFEMSVYNSGGKVNFFTRGFEDVTTVSSDDLLGDVEFKINSSLDLPDKVSVSFADPARDLQVGSLIETRTSRPGNNVETMDVPFTLSSDQARLYAQRRLYRSWTERRPVTLQLKPKWAYYIQAGDHINLSYSGGNTFRIRVDVAARGKFSQLEIEGVVTATDLVDNETTTPTGTVPTDQNPYVPAELLTFVLDLPPLRAEDATVPVMYAAAGTENTTDEWKGATTVYERDLDEFDILDSLFVESEMASVATALPSPTTTAVWDNKNSITAVFYSDHAPESKTKSQVLDGDNHYSLGGEVIAVAEWTHVSGQTYTGTKLLRGRRNTPTTHSTNETLIPLDQNLSLVNVGASFINQQMVHRIVPALAQITNSDQLLTDPYTGKSVTPWNPVQFVSERDGSDNVTINWTRRTRIPTALFATPVPLDEPTEKYTLTLKNTSNTILRTETVEDATSYVYTAALQTADGHTPGDLLNITVKQIGLHLDSAESEILNQ